MATKPAYKSRIESRIERRQHPVKGLNLFDPITDVGEGYALRLDNFVGRADGARVRDGFEVESVVPAPITMLLTHRNAVFACTDGAIYDGASPVVTGTLSGDWMGCTMSNPGGQWLMCVNGADYPRVFGGVDWEIASISGADPAALYGIIEHNRRFWFHERDSLDLYYLPLWAKGGALKRFPMDAQFRSSSRIVSIGSYQPSGGYGPDNKLVVVTDSGEMAVYSGVNPDVKGGMTIDGVWTIPRPVGRWAVTQFGSKLVIITEKGMIPVPDVMAAADEDKAILSLSRFVDKATTRPTFALDSVSSRLGIFQDGDVQWVRSDTKAWSRFTGLQATSWADCNGKLWFGRSDGKLCRYIGGNDAGQPIKSFVVDGFSRFKTPQIKIGSKVRPHYTLNHPYTPRMQMLANYRDPPANFDAANVNTGSWTWDSWTWDTAWRQRASRTQPWRGIGGRGHALALMMSMKTTEPVTWTGYDFEYTLGGTI